MTSLHSRLSPQLAPAHPSTSSHPPLGVFMSSVPWGQVGAAVVGACVGVLVVGEGVGEGVGEVDGAGEGA